uniref:Predicted protein n=1 Tax=Hordeum vulgare subsp. vulgare TaxID=112509 RepID=F2CVJ8_HORVV|nr:predicted protein [Hordeum vulgare subsp. vulgare]
MRRERPRALLLRPPRNHRPYQSKPAEHHGRDGKPLSSTRTAMSAALLAAAAPSPLPPAYWGRRPLLAAPPLALGCLRLQPPLLPQSRRLPAKPSLCRARRGAGARRRRSRVRPMSPASGARSRGGWRWARSWAPPPCSAAAARRSRPQRTPSRRPGSGCGWRRRCGASAGPTTPSSSRWPRYRCSSDSGRVLDAPAPRPADRPGSFGVCFFYLKCQCFQWRCQNYTLV